MVHHLKMPAAFASLGIDGHNGLAEQVIARAVAAVEVVGRCIDRQVHQSQFRIGAHHRPHAAVAGATPGFFFPGIHAVLAGQWDGMKGPHGLAGMHIETTHPHGRALSQQGSRLSYCRSDYNIADYNRR